MMKIKALNDETSTSSDDQMNDTNGNSSVLLTKEAEEERLNSLYSEALKKLKDGNSEEAKELLLKLSDLLKNIENDRKRIANYDKLRFLTAKNLGLICTDNLDYFAEALSIDEKDVSLWLKTGERAFKVFTNYPLARNCFEMCLHLSPTNWIAIDRLIDTYFVLHDLTNCYYTCVDALKMDDSYLKPQVLIAEIARLFPPIVKDMKDEYKKYLKISDENKEYSEKLFSSLRLLKEKRKQHFDELKAQQEAKRRCMRLNLEITPNLNVNELGLQIFKLHQRMIEQQISTATGIEVLFESKSNQNEEGYSADESASGEESEKEKSGKSSSRGSSHGFPIEFLDKRRSSRVQKIQTRTRESTDSIMDKIQQILPTSIISRRQNSKETHSDENNDTKSDADIDAEIVKKFINKQQCHKKTKQVQRIHNIIDDYLYELSHYATMVTLPEVFLDLYKIHRQMNSFPCVAYSIIGKDIELDEIWCTLAANELKHNRNECIFLTEVSIPLEAVLDDEKYHEFLIRLLVLRGTKESCIDFLEYAQNSMINRPQSVPAGNKTTITLSTIKSFINSKSDNSFVSLLNDGKYDEIIELFNSESQIAENELETICEAIKSSNKWDVGVEIVSSCKRLNDTHLKLLKSCLETGKRAKISFDLAKKLILMATESSSVLAWICLFWSFESERDDYAIEENFISFINIAHQHLGKKGLCTSNNGEFLLISLNFLLNHCSASKDDMILQCFSCLYGHPQRKNALLQSHSSPIQLTWENAELIYSYFIPEELPEFDSLYRNNSINSETEQLLIRIACLVPENLNPKNYVKWIEDYIETGVENDPSSKIEKNNVTHNLYYFLADYYFKNKEFKKAKLYYKFDLCLNYDRFDSWAASALARSSLLDQHLISVSYEISSTIISLYHLMASQGDNPIYRNPEKFYKAADSAFRCYSRALKLDPSNTKLWIEYGSLAYNISSHASRLKKEAIYYNTRSKTNSGFDIEKLEQKRKEMLKIAKYCFESANNTDCKDEIWLHYYLLGKIAEKSDLLQALHYYELADLYLFLNGASYPKKISYHNPSYLSIEALEIHYRIHCAALKFLTSTHRLTRKALQKIRVYLVRAYRSPFVKQMNSSYPTILDHDYTSGPLNSASNSLSRTMDAVSELIGDMVEIVADRIDKVDEGKLKASLIELCLNAMKRCLIRFGPHYKSLYRLAYYYYSTGDVQMAKNILMNNFTVSIRSHSFVSALYASGDEFGNNGTQQDSVQKTITIGGLFAERKNNNLFNAIWRIPADDIDRPGSFSTHMYRSTLLLLRICTTVFDYQNLCTIAIQLNRTPDAGKKYLRDADRLRLSREAFESCSLMLKNQLMNVSLQREVRERFAIELYRVCDRMIKANVFANEASLLISESYKLLKNV
ncbi:hypothetical protein B4U79_00407 [Dinothrombium tinctorium]|uniref:Calcineurin-binding protein cabin-1-like protein n=1 Tax=Dinothrombium tinctorium TaxID=1965070 RepID=A0A443R6W6_9ACAR|nr:hypothetical protein B4U79_00407 [Dinothrombium tinctorium]